LTARLSRWKGGRGARGQAALSKRRSRGVSAPVDNIYNPFSVVEKTNRTGKALGKTAVVTLEHACRHVI
jgi:hypothetical protein